jgi:hypothetical protein
MHWGIEMAEHQPIPVAGYKPQSQETIDRVNDNKRVEEALLQTMDEMQGDANYDQRWLAIARTDIEKGFMALNRAIFKPDRVKL